MKNILQSVVLFAAIIQLPHASAAWEAILTNTTVYPGSVGYVYGKAGFEFAVDTDVMITALGCRGDETNTIQLFDAGTNLLAQASVPERSFTPITSVRLAAGTTNYILAFITDYYATGGGFFSLAPMIENLVLAPNLRFIRPCAQLQPSFAIEGIDLLLNVATFEFITNAIVAEGPMLSISVTRSDAIQLAWPTNFGHAKIQGGDTPSTAAMTNLDAIPLTVGTNLVVELPAQPQGAFFRLKVD